MLYKCFFSRMRAGQCLGVLHPFQYAQAVHACDVRHIAHAQRHVFDAGQVCGDISYPPRFRRNTVGCADCYRKPAFLCRDKVGNKGLQVGGIDYHAKLALAANDRGEAFFAVIAPPRYFQRCKRKALRRTGKRRIVYGHPDNALLFAVKCLLETCAHCLSYSAIPGFGTAYQN